MRTQELEIYYPQEATINGERVTIRGALPAQIAAHAACDDNQYVAFTGGIGSAKTRWGAAQVARHLLRQTEDTEGIVCARSFGMLRDVDVPAILRQFEFLREQREGAFSCEYKRSDNLIYLRVGPYKHLCHLMYAGDAGLADRARGIEIGWLWIDEAALVPREAYLVLRGRLRRYRELRMWVTSTPKGKRHWLWQYSQRGVAIHAKTKDNPVTQHLAEELRAVYGSRLSAQERDGEFLATEAAAFPELNYGEPREVTRVIVGVDWGFTNEGAAVALAIGDDRFCFCDEVVERGQTRTWWANRLAAMRDDLQARFGVEPTFYADPEDPAAREECRQQVRILPAENKRLAGFRALQSVLERGYVSPACKRLIADATAAEWALDKLGNPLEGELPDGYPDHTLDAARYAAIAATGKPRRVVRSLLADEEAVPA